MSTQVAAKFADLQLAPGAEPEPGHWETPGYVSFCDKYMRADSKHYCIDMKNKPLRERFGAGVEFARAHGHGTFVLPLDTITEKGWYSFIEACMNAGLMSLDWGWGMLYEPADKDETTPRAVYVVIGEQLYEQLKNSGKKFPL